MQISFSNYQEFLQIQQEVQAGNFIEVEEIQYMTNNHLQNYCQSTKQQCKFLLYRLADFSMTKEQISQLPSMFIMSGTQEDQLIGINSLLNFILKFKIDPPFEIQQLLKYVQILIMPVADPQQFEEIFLKQQLQKQNQKEKKDIFDIQQKSNQCFQNPSSQIISKIYEDNLIVFSLNILKDNIDHLEYPNLQRNNQKQPNSPDLIIFTELYQIIKNVYNQNQKSQILDIKDAYTQNRIQNLQNYSLWAYTASWSNIYKKKVCVINNKLEIINTNINSNRAISFDLFINEKELLQQNGMQEQNEEMNLKIQNFYDTTQKIILTISRTLNPYIDIKSIYQKQTNLYLNMLVYGCLSFSIDSIFVEGYQSFIQIIRQNILEKIYEVQLSIQNFDSRILYFQLQCNKNIQSDLLESIPQSHFYRMKLDPGYHVEQKAQKIFSTCNQKYIIKNINMKLINKGQIFQHDKQKFVLLYTKKIYALFPKTNIKLAITYDQGKISSELFGQEKLEKHTIQIQKYGDYRCMRNQFFRNERNFFIVAQNLKINKNDFYNMIGSAVQLVDQNGEIQDYSILQTNNINNIIPLEEKMLINNSENDNILILVTQNNKFTNIYLQTQFQGEITINIGIKHLKKFYKTQNSIYGNYKLQFQTVMNLHGTYYELFLNEKLIDKGQFGKKNPFCIFQNMHNKVQMSIVQNQKEEIALFYYVFLISGILFVITCTLLIIQKIITKHQIQMKNFEQKDKKNLPSKNNQFNFKQYALLISLQDLFLLFLTRYMRRYFAKYYNTSYKIIYTMFLLISKLNYFFDLIGFYLQFNINIESLDSQSLAKQSKVLPILFIYYTTVLQIYISESIYYYIFFILFFYCNSKSLAKPSFFLQMLDFNPAQIKEPPPNIRLLFNFLSSGKFINFKLSVVVLPC